MNSSSGSRFDFLDALKAVASQLIVLHHLAFYGPMADHVRPLAPALIDWLGSHARIAVQVFLVVGGFLAAKSLSPQGMPVIGDPLRAVMRRYMKLAPPFLVAIGLAVAASALARSWMTHDSISAAPGLPQLAAHALLLQNILGYEALSAGAWYVSIDFQLYAMLTALLWLPGRVPGGGRSRGRRTGGRRERWLVAALVAAGVAASLMYFNRNAAWDSWAPYFFGSYGLGALAWWSSDTGRRRAVAIVLLCAMLLLALPALALDFRSRIVVALVTALALVAVHRGGLSFPGQRSAAARFLGRISYAVFLVHFPVCLIVNGAFTRFAPAQPLAQAVGVLLAWAASVAAGAAFHRWVEIPLGRIAARRAPFFAACAKIEQNYREAKFRIVILHPRIAARAPTAARMSERTK